MQSSILLDCFFIHIIVKFNKERSDFMKESTILSRLGAYIVDIFIVGFVIFLITKIITSAVKLPEFSTDIINTMPSNVKDVYDALKASNGSVSFTDLYLECYMKGGEIKKAFLSWLTTSDISSYYSELQSKTWTILSLEIVTSLILYALYFVVLPCFWDKQTVGRLLLKVKVVKLDDSACSWGQFLTRDIIGSYVLQILNVCCGLHLILNIIFVLSRNKTLGDMISGTHLVSTNQVESNIVEKSNTTFVRPERVSDDDIEIIVDDKND